MSSRDPLQEKRLYEQKKISATLFKSTCLGKDTFDDLSESIKKVSTIGGSLGRFIYHEEQIEPFKKALNAALGKLENTGHIIPEWKQYYMPWYLETQREKKR